jgi:SAM-dependent methyltransferase
MIKAELTHQVSEERWQEAQHWEEAHWISAQNARAKYGKNWIWRILHAARLVEKYRGDDWNLWWKTQFQDFKFLPDQVDNAIEVGCGPYTNIRHIVPTCRPKHFFLSDPLIKTYVNFKLAFTADAYRKAFCILDDHPLEEIPYRDNYFDLVVMINVLDHVRDASLCMENLIRITKPGGWVVVGQDLTNEEDLDVLSRDSGLVGHPVKISYEWFAPYFATGFNPAINKVLSRNEGREPEHHYGTMVFAGSKQLGAVHK